MSHFIVQVVDFLSFCLRSGYRWASIGFVAAYDCNYTTDVIDIFSNLFCLSLRSCIPNYEMGGDANRHISRTVPCNIDFSVEASPSSDSAPKSCFRKGEWMPVSNMLNLRCVYRHMQLNKHSIGSTSCVISRFVHSRGSQERDSGCESEVNIIVCIIILGIQCHCYGTRSCEP
jgi:hypothetical protein